MHQIQFRLGLRLWELTALPQTSWIQATVLSRGMDRMKEKGRKGKKKAVA